MDNRGMRKSMIGNVTSNKMDKTVVVQVEAIKKHPLYKKQIKVRKSYKAHDKNNECNIGDRVEIIETRPLSRDKRWRVSKILQKSVS